MTRHDKDQKNDDDHRRVGAGGAVGAGGGISSHPPNSNSGQSTNVDKPEKESKSANNPPIEQHRSSRRPRQRKENAR